MWYVGLFQVQLLPFNLHESIGARQWWPRVLQEKKVQGNDLHGGSLVGDCRSREIVRRRRVEDEL
jgi:hypothetical protein